MTGGALNLRDVNDVTLGSISATSLTLLSGGTISQSAAATISGTATFDSGGADTNLTQAGNKIGTFAATTSGAATITNNQALALATINVGSLTVDTSGANGAVTQTAAASVSGATQVNAGTGSITLTQATNDFASVSATGGAIAITDANGLVLGTTSATSLAVNVAAALTQSGALTVSGATTIGAGVANVTLTDKSNDFSSISVTGGAVALRDANALVLASSNVGSLNLTTGGALTQSAAVTVAGAATIDADSSAITLNNASNDFGSVDVKTTGGAVSLRDKNSLTVTSLVSGANKDVTVVAGNALSMPLGSIDTGTANLVLTAGDALTTFGDLSGKNVTITGNDGLTIGDNLTATGTLSLNTTNFAITQTAGTLSAAGGANVSTGSGAITLNQPTNNFGTLVVSGGSIALRDANDLTITSLTSGANQGVSIIAGGSLNLPAGGINTGTANLTLNAGTSITTGGALSGADITLNGAGGLSLGHAITTTGNLSLTTTNSDINQTAGSLSIAGLATVNAGSGNVKLTQPNNDFGSVTLTGGAISLVDTSGLTVNSVTNGTNQAVSIQAGNSLSLLQAGTLDTGTADLTLTATSGLLSLSGPLAGAAVTLTGGGAGIGLGGDVTSTGTQTYAGNVLAFQNTVLDAGSARINLQGSYNGGGTALTLNSSNAAADAIRSAGGMSNVSNLAVNGNLTLESSVTTAETQSYASPVVLGGNATLTGSDITFNSTINGAQDLAISVSGVATLKGNVGGTTPLTTLAISGAGSALIGQDPNQTTVKTSGDQSYQVPVTLAGDLLVVGDDLVFGKLLNTKVFVFETQSSTVQFLGGITGTGTFVLAPNADQTIGIAGASGTFQVSQGQLDGLKDYATIIIGRSDTTTKDIASNSVTLPSNLRIRSTSGNVTFNGTVDSSVGVGDKNLQVDTSGLVTFSGAVGGLQPLGNVTINTKSSIGASSIIATGTQNYAGPTTITADATIQGASLSFNSSLATGSQDVKLLGDAIAITGPVTGTGTVQLAPITASTSIGLAGGAGTLQISQSTLDAFGSLAQLTIGQVGGTGDITAGALTLTTDTVVQSAFGNVAFTGVIESAVGGAKDLTVNTSGLTSFGGSVGATRPLDVLSIAGAAQFGGGTLSSSGAQTFGSSLLLSGDTTQRASAVTVGGTLTTGANQLDIQAGSITFGGAVVGTGNLLLAPDVANGSIGLSGGAGGLQISQATLDKFAGYNRVTIGRADGTGALTAGNVTMPAHVTLRSASGAMQLTGTINDATAGTHDLVVSTTGNTTLGGAVGAVAAPRSVSISGPVAINGAAVSTTGGQSYGAAVTLGTGTTLSGSSVAVTGTLAHGANSLAMFADSLTMGATATGNGAVQLAPAAAGGTVGAAGGSGALQLSQALLDAFASSSTLTVGRADGVALITAGALTLPTDMVIQSGSGAITLSGLVDSALGGARDLAVNTTGLTTIGSSVGTIRVLDTLSIAGAAQFAGGSILTSGAQTYSGNLTLAGGSMLRASAVTFAQDLAAGANAVDIQAAAMAFNGNVSGSGQLLLAADAAGTTIGLAGAAGTLQISQATLNKFAGFSAVTIGRTDGTGALTANALTLPTDLTLRSGSGAVNLTSSVDGASAGVQDLAVSTTGTTTLGGAVGASAALASLSATGPVAINGTVVTTTGAQAYGAAVSLGAPTTLSGSTVGITGTLNNGTNPLAVFADSVTMGAASTGSGSVQLAPSSAGGSIGMTGAAGTLQLSQALLDAFATSSGLTIGRTDGTGAINANVMTLPTDMVIRSSTGSVTLGDTVNSGSGARDLAVNTSGLTSLNGAVGASAPLDTLAVSGASSLSAGSVTTAGAQTYTGAVTLGSANVLTGTAISFGSTVNGAQALTVNATGNTSFGTAVGGTTALASLTTDAAGATLIGGNVSTTGAQSYGDKLTLNADSTLTASAITLGGTVDGSKALVLDAADATVSAAIGNTAALNTLTATGRTALNGGSITTTGAQAFAGASTLGAATTINAATVTFGSALDGAQTLAINSAGNTAFGGAVGGTTALTSLALAGGGTVTLAGAGVTTSGAQSYSGSLTVGGANATFTASGLTFGGNVGGAKDLTLLTDALTATGISGSGVLTIAPQDKSISIGLAGAAGAMQISQATIDSAAGFTAHAFGRADGTGAIQSSDLTLRANTTLQTNTGDIRMNGKVDGAFDLTLNSGGQTRIAGPVGSVTALKSLTTDNNAGAADFDGKAGEQTVFDLADNTGRARVITTGAQTFNDPLNASVPMQFIGGAIKAVQPTSSFAGAIMATADSLSLASGAAITLGDVTLANGGAIQTGGLLDLSGALTLNGGSLVLTSTATPTALAAFTDAELKSKGNLAFGTLPVKEASATVFQSGTGVITTAAGSVLALRSPAGGTISLTAAGNKLGGGISAVSGTLNDTAIDRFNLGPEILLGEVRIVADRIQVVGAPPASNDQSVVNAGLEADFMRLSADQLATGTDGQIRVRLPYNSAQGTRTSVPGITFEMGAEALKTFGNFGGNNADTWVQVSVGGTVGGFLTVVPKGVGALPGATILLGGQPFPVPFYDGTGKLDQVRVFYNGATTQTAQETGALQAVTAVVEDARQSRFEEAVRTENVTARLRSGVIAEVGAGRPATVGRETIRLPQTCDVRPGQLKCE
ncbi:MAG: beta strand repeat-containing protein [Aquabacterium sp.]